jgi:hypothetical protein
VNNEVSVAQDAEPLYAPTNFAYVGPVSPVVLTVLNVNVVNAYKEVCVVGVTVGVTVLDGV